MWFWGRHFNQRGEELLLTDFSTCVRSINTQQKTGNYLEIQPRITDMPIRTKIITWPLCLLKYAVEIDCTNYDTEDSDSIKFTGDLCRYYRLLEVHGFSLSCVKCNVLSSTLSVVVTGTMQTINTLLIVGTIFSEQPCRDPHCDHISNEDLTSWKTIPKLTVCLQGPGIFAELSVGTAPPHCEGPWKWHCCPAMSHKPHKYTHTHTHMQVHTHTRTHIVTSRLSVAEMSRCGRGATRRHVSCLAALRRLRDDFLQ